MAHSLGALAPGTSPSAFSGLRRHFGDRYGCVQLRSAGPCRHVRQARGSARRIRASSESADGLRRHISNLVKSDLYSKYAQGAVFVGVLAAVDAGYSGDWSRIGAISTATEEWLKQVLPLLAAFHVFSAAVSGVTASRAGRPWQWPFVKAAAVGGLAMFEQLLQVDD